MKILVTSSTGLTGKAVVKALAEKGAHVRAMIHSDRRKDEMLSLGAAETIIASIESQDGMREAMNGMDAVFYICPTAHPIPRTILQLIFTRNVDLRKATTLLIKDWVISLSQALNL